MSSSRVERPQNRNIQPAPNPAPPGNKRSVKYGAWSESLIQPRAAELSEHVFDVNAHLDPARDGAAVARYAVTLARVERVYRWLAEQADTVFADEAAGEVHAVYERLEKWEAGAERAEDRLAIAPLTRAKLGLDRARGAALFEQAMRERSE